MEIFRRMVNDCIKIGITNEVSTLKRLCMLSYSGLSKYNVLTYYKLCAVSHAAGILANRKKSMKRGLKPRNPYARRALLSSCYGFKLVDNNSLKVPFANRQFINIPLNDYVRRILSNRELRIRSFTITCDSLSICISREAKAVDCEATEGIDRNLRNITVGNRDNLVQYDLTKTVDITANTRSILRSFKRPDHRIMKKLNHLHSNDM